MHTPHTQHIKQRTLFPAITFVSAKIIKTKVFVGCILTVFEHSVNKNNTYLWNCQSRVFNFPQVLWSAKS